MSSVGLTIHRLEPQSARGPRAVGEDLGCGDGAVSKGRLRAGVDRRDPACRAAARSRRSTRTSRRKQDLFRSVIDNVVDNSDLGTALDISANARARPHGVRREPATRRAFAAPPCRARPGHRGARAISGSRANLLGAWAATSRRLSSDLPRGLKQSRDIAIEDAEEAAEFFIGMLFQHWHRQLFYVNVPPPERSR